MKITRPWTCAAVVLLLLLVAAAGLWLTSRPGISPDSIQNILLISIDTCRADHLGCYGDPRTITPHIDRLAAEATRFQNVISPVPLTLPSHCSMLTGANPADHGVHDNLDYELADEHVTLAEILHDQGFATGGLISAYVLDRRFGLDQGFESYDDQFEEERLIGNMSERVGGEAARLAAEWLRDHRRERFFFFLHFFDPHHEYEPPEPFASRFPDSPYAGEIAYTDHCVGKVLDELRRLKLYDSTLIILTADHGEMLGEHGEQGHSYFIYQGAVQVPLIVKLPGRRDGQVVTQLAGLVDLVPTLCGLLRMEPPAQVPGIDLSPFLLGNPAPVDRYVYCESLTPTKFQANSLLGVVGADWKYIQTTRPELYHLKTDPAESRNLFVDQPHQAEIMQDQLRKFLESSVDSSESSLHARDEESLRRLESLGYIGSTQVVKAYEFDTSKEDPKDAIRLHRANEQVQTLIFQEEYDRARMLCAQLIKERPGLFLPRYSMGRIESRLGHFVQAIEYLRKAAGLKSDSPEVYNELGSALRNAGQLREAQAAFQEALQLNTDFAEAHANLGVTLAALNEPDEAIAHYRAALSLQPDVAETHNNLGVVLASLRRLDEAVHHYRRAIELKADYAEAYSNLGAALSSLDDVDEAIVQYGKALQITPESPGAHHNLAKALEKQDKLDEALDHYRQSVRLSPAVPIFHSSLGKALRAQGRLDEAMQSFREVVRLSPGSYLAHYALANTLASQGELEQALTHYRRAIELNPNFASAHTNAGNALSSLGRFSEATKHYQRALEIAPDSAFAHYNYAVCLAAQDKMAEALENYQHVLRLQPEWPEALNGMAWILATHWDDSVRDPSQALPYAQRAAEMTGWKNPAVLDTLAAAYAANGQFDKSIQIVEKALALIQKESANNMAQTLRARLQLYRSSRPFISERPPKS